MVPANGPVWLTHPPTHQPTHHNNTTIGTPGPSFPDGGGVVPGGPANVNHEVYVRRFVASYTFLRRLSLYHLCYVIQVSHPSPNQLTTQTQTPPPTNKPHTKKNRLAEEERYLKMTAREIRRLCMLTLAFIRQASAWFGGKGASGRGWWWSWLLLLLLTSSPMIKNQL